MVNCESYDKDAKGLFKNVIYIDWIVSGHTNYTNLLSLLCTLTCYYKCLSIKSLQNLS